MLPSNQVLVIEEFIHQMNVVPGSPVVYCGHTTDKIGIKLKMFVLKPNDRQYLVFPISWRDAKAILTTLWEG